MTDLIRYQASQAHRDRLIASGFAFFEGSEDSVTISERLVAEEQMDNTEPLARNGSRISYVSHGASLRARTAPHFHRRSASHATLRRPLRSRVLAFGVRRCSA